MPNNDDKLYELMYGAGRANWNERKRLADEWGNIVHKGWTWIGWVWVGVILCNIANVINITTESWQIALGFVIVGMIVFLFGTIGWIRNLILSKRAEKAYMNHE